MEIGFEIRVFGKLASEDGSDWDIDIDEVVYLDITFDSDELDACYDYCYNGESSNLMDEKIRGAVSTYLFRNYKIDDFDVDFEVESCGL